MRRLLMIGLLLALALPALAEGRLRASEMRSKGIDMFSFQPISFSHDGKTLLAFERAPLEEKKKGVFFRLWFIQVRSDGSLGEMRSVGLSVPQVEQATFTPDDSKVVVMSRSRTEFLAVDSDTLEVSTIMKAEAGQPGFRGEPAVLWTNSGQLFVTGQFYDEKRYVDERTIATLNPDQQGTAAFTAGPNIFRLERSLPNLWFINYNRDDLGFFGQKKSDQSILSVWRGGDTVTEIDRAPSYAGFWGSASRLLYSAGRTGAPSDLIVYDAELEKKWLLGSAENPYRYLFLSKDGGTAIACQISDNQRMDIFIAREDDEFQLKPAEGLNNQLIGWLRISPNGKLLCLFNQLGLHIHELP